MEVRRDRLAALAAIVVATSAFAGVASLLAPRGVLFDRDDPLGYYVYLRSAAQDQDLDFANEFAYFRQRVADLGVNLGAISANTGRLDNNHTIGFPLLVAPVYLALRLLLMPLYVGDTFPWFLDQLLFSLGALLIGWLGLYLTARFVSTAGAHRHALAATVVFWACSPLAYYFIREPFTSHLGSLFAVSGYLWAWTNARWSAERRRLVMGLFAGLVVATRQQDVVLLLVPLLSGVRRGDKRPAWNWRAGGAFAAAFAIPLSAQMATWWTLRGEAFSYAYAGQGFSNWRSPQVLDVLFSSNHGLLFWHPAIAVCLAGWVLCPREHRPLAAAAAVVFALEILIIGAWWSWWMGQSFGQRGLLSVTPLFVWGLANLLDRLRTARERAMIWSALAVCATWNVVLMAAYLSDLIPHEGTFSGAELLGRLPELPSAVWGKVLSL